MEARLLGRESVDRCRGKEAGEEKDLTLGNIFLETGKGRSLERVFPPGHEVLYPVGIRGEMFWE